MIKIGCNTVAFRTMDLDFALDKIASIGYEYVEVEANLKWCPHIDPWKDDPIKFKDKVESFGFKGVSAIGSHRELITSEQGVKDIKRALEWANVANVPVVLTGEGRLSPEISTQEALNILEEKYQEILEVAEKNKVYLAIEDHGSISLKPDGLPKLLKLSNSKWLAVNFDTANIRRGDYVGTDGNNYEWKLENKGLGGYSETELLEKIANRVKHVHIKDVIGRDAVILGQGEIDITGCIKILDNAGFDGVLSYETEGMEEPEESIKMIRESRQFLLDSLANLS